MPASKLKNFRVFFLLAILLIFATIILLREHRPSFLRPGLHLNAYVATSDGITVIDLAGLRAIAKIPIGQGIADLREHPRRDEIWGVNTAGYIFILDAPLQQIASRIAVGSSYSLDFSPSGDRAFTTSSSTDELIAIDCATRSIIGRAKTAGEPVQARITPDNKSILVVNRRGSALGIHDAATLQLRASVNVIPHPDEVAIMPDSSLAFVMSRSENRLSVVDLKRGVLLTNLVLAGKPSQLVMKSDGGELYVISPESHGLQTVNTSTHEMGDSMTLGAAPASAILTSDDGKMYVSDRDAGRIMPVDIINRRTGGPISVGAAPNAMRFDPTAPGANPSMLLVANENSGDLGIIRLRTDTLITLIPVGPHPARLAVKLF